MLYREITAVCSEIHTKHINTLCGQSVEFVNVKPGSTYSNHLALKGYIPYRAVNILSWLLKTSQLMLYREIISACFQNSTKHTYALCGQSAEFCLSNLAVHTVTIKLGGEQLRLQNRFQNITIDLTC
jgi:hypothetical protein